MENGSHKILLKKIVNKDVIYQNISMKKFNSWKVGGNAENYIEVSSEFRLQEVLEQKKIKLPITVIGLGSNVLIRDGGLKGTVINLSRGMKEIKNDENSIYAECGVSCSSLARYAAKNKKKSCAFLAGIPGSIGGALAMNAGCYGNETWDFVHKVKTINFSGNIAIKSKDDFEISYRNVKNLKNDIFIGAWFNFPDLCEQDENEITRINKLLKIRRETQPLNWPTAGSTFKNPDNTFAAKLIQDAGLKGFTIGGARFSDKHANFIENMGNASADDIEQLIYLAQKKIRELNDIDLQIEVKILGDKSE